MDTFELFEDFTASFPLGVVISNPTEIRIYYRSSEIGEWLRNNNCYQLDRYKGTGLSGLVVGLSAGPEIAVDSILCQNAGDITLYQRLVPDQGPAWGPGLVYRVERNAIALYHVIDPTFPLDAPEKGAATGFPPKPYQFIVGQPVEFGRHVCGKCEHHVWA